MEEGRKDNRVHEGYLCMHACIYGFKSGYEE